MKKNKGKKRNSSMIQKNYSETGTPKFYTTSLSTKHSQSLNADSQFISLQVDFSFKFTMHNEKVLRGFLGAVLGIVPESITDIIFTDTNLDKEHKEEKQGILDISVTIDGNRQINIELQMAPFTYWENHSIFYNARMFASQKRKDKYYSHYIPCIHIGILGFNLTEEKEFHSEVMLQNTKTHRIYSDKLVFHMIELKKIKDVVEEEKNTLYYWASLIAAENQEEYDMLAKQNEYLQEAVNEIEKINLDEGLRHQYLRREMAIMDELTQREGFFEEGKKEGIKEGKKAIAKMGKLKKRLVEENEIDKIIEMIDNATLREELYKKYDIE